MDLPVAGFEWDNGNWPKCGKHGVTKGEIEALFARDLAVYPDPAHSQSEPRFLAIGTTIGDRWLLVAFTLRSCDGQTLIRPISARFMHRQEVEHYERQDRP